jgi:PAS domain S-box-containing protein
MVATFGSGWMPADTLALAKGTSSVTNRQLPKHVLILNSHDYDMPWQSAVNHSIYAVVKADSEITTEIHTEYTCLSHHFDTDYERKLLDLYHQKYAGQKMDLIIAVDVASTNFLVKHGDELFPKAPVVFVSDTESIEEMGLKPNMTGVLSKIDVKGTLDLALRLHPDTRHIAVVSGASKMDHLFEAKTRQIFQEYEKRFAFTYLTDLPMDVILARVAQLPEHSIVLYVLTLVDGAGKNFIPREIVSRVSKASNAPVYGFYDSFLGSGIVGGHLSSAELEGKKTALMGLRILRGEKPGDIPIVQGSHAYLFDWRQLQRWHIRERDLPAGSVVRNKQITFWDLYKWHLTSVSALLVFQGLLILSLLIQLKKRRRAELMLKKSHDNLEFSVEQRTANLIQINAQLQKEIKERKQAEQTLADSEQRLADIIEFLPDPTWVIDLEGRVIAWNRAMKRMSGIEKNEIIGKGDYAYSIPFYGEPRPALINLVLQRDKKWEEKYLGLKEEDGVLISSESFHPLMGNGGCYLAGAAARIYDARGNIVGAIESLRDITITKRSEQERERLIKDLQNALAKVRTLSGLLPICASCKNIRDDKGYWNQIETYISNHSEVAFSHGLCPGCMEKLYGNQEWYKKNRNKAGDQEQT